METGTRIILENCEREENDLIIQPDFGGAESRNLIGFSIILDGERLPISEKKINPDDGGETYFHINKEQTKVLINYLQSLCDDM